MQTGMAENKTAAPELLDISEQETAHHFAAGLTDTLSQNDTLLLLIARKSQLLKRIPVFVIHILCIFLSFGFELLIGQNEQSVS